MVPSPASSQLIPPMVPISLSRVVHRRDSQTRTTPTIQPRKGITSTTRAMTSSHGVAGLAGAAGTPKRSRASAAMSAGSPRRSSMLRTPASVSGSRPARAVAMCSPTSSMSSWRRLAGRSWSSASRSWR